MSTKSRVIVLAAVAALALAGCAPVVSAPTNSPAAAPTTEPSASATPIATPTPTPTPAPTADASVLFTITATAVASGGNGAKVDLSETVYAPSATTTDTAGDTALLNKQCSGWQTQYPQHAFLVAELSSKLEAGSPTWPKKTLPVVAGVDGLDPSAYSGAFSGFESECAPGVMVFPGTIHVVVVVGTGNIHGQKGWAGQRYGFGLALDGPIQTIPAKDRSKIINCVITLGPVALADSVVSKWPSETAAIADSGSCFANPNAN